MLKTPPTRAPKEGSCKRRHPPQGHARRIVGRRFRSDRPAAGWVQTDRANWTQPNNKNPAATMTMIHRPLSLYRQTSAAELALIRRLAFW